jgi:hypothetical protein
MEMRVVDNLRFGASACVAIEHLQREAGLRTNHFGFVIGVEVNVKFHFAKLGDCSGSAAACLRARVKKLFGMC